MDGHIGVLASKFYSEHGRTDFRYLVGYSAGININTSNSFEKGISYSLGIGFSSRGSSTIRNLWRISLNYLEAPISVRIGFEKLYIKAGASPAFLVHHEESVQTTITIPLKGESVNKFAFDIFGGVGVTINNIFYIEMLAYNSILNIYVDKVYSTSGAEMDNWNKQFFGVINFGVIKSL